MSYHVARKHDKSLNYPCTDDPENCTQKFADPSYLCRHRQIAHGYKPQKINRTARSHTAQVKDIKARAGSSKPRGRARKPNNGKEAATGTPEHTAVGPSSSSTWRPISSSSSGNPEIMTDFEGLLSFDDNSISTQMTNCDVDTYAQEYSDVLPQTSAQQDVPQSDAAPQTVSLDESQAINTSVCRTNPESLLNASLFFTNLLLRGQQPPSFLAPWRRNILPPPPPHVLDQNRTQAAIQLFALGVWKSERDSIHLRNSDTSTVPTETPPPSESHVMNMYSEGAQ
ncbi:hypothetical protein CVT24_003893 [Panaeolus cyanescens]|uniref:C2H2-type domain-containing protein n=1 Tax=Panaeolus cyanescens TaxID=181874 RepID=A0A409VV78_9AGAR|nr:hypothetical protein CVT24_003893 [Panaeolus cyanescens]